MNKRQASCQRRRNRRTKDPIPAVHPRYRNIYRTLYEEPAQPGSTFGFRLFFCLILFGLFLIADQEAVRLGSYDTEKAVKMISTDAAVPSFSQVQQVWEEMVGREINEDR